MNTVFRLLLLLVILTFQLTLSGQGQVDSLQLLIKDAGNALMRNPNKAKQIQLKVDSLAHLLGDSVWIYEARMSNAIIERNMGNHAFALEEFERYISFQQLKNDEERLIKGYKLAGSLYVREGEFEKAETYLNLAKDGYNNQRDTVELCRVYRSQGMMHSQKASYSKALEQYLMAIELLKRIKSIRQLNATYNSLGLLYQDMGQKDKAKETYALTYELNEKARDTIRMANALANLAGIASSLDSTILLFNQAIELYDKVGAKGRASSMRLNLGMAYLDNGELSKARAQLRPTYIRQGAKTHPYALQKLAEADAKLGYTNEANEIMTILEEVIPQFPDAKSRSSSYSQMSKIYTLLGQHRRSNEYLFKYKDLQDSIFTADSQRQVAELETQYKVKEKQAEIDRLALEDELNESRLGRQRLALGGSIGVLGLLSFFLYRLFGQNRQIKKQNGIITKANKEKEVLLKEIHHRVKNNLQVISSLLGLQSLSIKDQAAKDAIQEGRSRVHSMSLIHQNLYNKDDLSGIEMTSYIKKLCRDLVGTYHVGDTDITVYEDIQPELMLDVETVVPLGLIINELVTNSLKYAFDNRANGLISVTLKEVNEQLVLKVKDDGVGMNDSSVKDENNSFGLSLISAFQEKLGATIDIDGSDGTVVTMSINNYKKL